MEQKQSAAPKVFSMIFMITSVIACICAVILRGIVGSVTGSSGSATAVTNSAVITVAGIVFLSAGTWVFSLIGGVGGFIMLIIDLVIKRVKILWIPVTAIILGVISVMITVLAY